MLSRWVGASYPPPLTNRPVFDLNGRHIGTPDLIDPNTGVMGEYDSLIFHNAARRAKDLQRDHDFRSHGLEPVSMVTGDLEFAGAFLMRLRAAYARAEARPASERRWTLELPPWWVPTFTVAQRRALSESQRKIWLRHRRPPGDDLLAG